MPFLGNDEIANNIAVVVEHLLKKQSVTKDEQVVIRACVELANNFLQNLNNIDYALNNIDQTLANRS